MKEIIVDDILDRYCPDIENVINISKDDIKAAIKEIVKEVLKAAAENAKWDRDEIKGAEIIYIVSSSILNTSNQVKY